jgi:hypothetical protein
MKTWAATICLLTAWPCLAQRDFLRADEVDLLREAQDPNDRLPLYVRFAKERVSLIQQYAAKEKAGRAALIRETLEEYTKIVDAIDTVTDDALRRGKPVEKGLAFVTSGERDLLAALRRVAKSAPPDMAIYKFSLDQAIAATSDSLDLALDDLGSRSADIKAKDEQERKEREALMRPEEVEAKRGQEKKDADSKKKAPTLRRPGEAAPPKG